MRRTNATLAAAAVLAMTALAGCSASGRPTESQSSASAGTTQAAASAGATEADAPGVPALDVATPTIGQCWILPDVASGKTWHTWGGAPAVDCAAEHTAVTFAVAQLPDGAYPTDDAPATPTVTAASNAASNAAIDSACFAPTQKQRVGTRLYAFWYLPTVEQWDAGARWARCDLSVLALGPTGTAALAPLAQTSDEILAAAHTGYQKCVDTPLPANENGPGAGWDQGSFVDCAGPHQWEMADGWYLLDAEYPGDDKVKSDARQMCTDINKIRHGAYWNVSYPTQTDWDTGSRFVQCWISPAS